MEETQRLRNLAAWYREFAELAGEPWIWLARLRRANELEQEAARYESQASQTPPAASPLEA
jgi:hypothetical protein